MHFTSTVGTIIYRGLEGVFLIGLDVGHQTVRQSAQRRKGGKKEGMKDRKTRMRTQYAGRAHFTTSF